MCSLYLWVSFIYLYKRPTFAFVIWKLVQCVFGLWFVGVSLMPMIGHGIYQMFIVRCRTFWYRNRVSWPIASVSVFIYVDVCMCVSISVWNYHKLKIIKKITIIIGSSCRTCWLVEGGTIELNVYPTSTQISRTNVIYDHFNIHFKST